MKLLVSTAAAALLLVVTPAVSDQVLRGHESVWTPEFPISTDVRAAKTYTTIPLFGDLSPMSFFNCYGEVSIGTPPQKFKMMFEISESVLWIPNFQVPSSTHSFYDHNKSSSYEADGTAYISDAVHGFLSRDTVRVGDLAVSNVSFAEATQVNFPPTVNFDGVFGLAPDLHHNFVLQRLLRSGTIGEPVFAFHLNKAKVEGKAVGGETSAGELTIGGVDKRHYTGSIRYVDTLVDTAWTVPLDAVTIGSSVSNNFVTVGEASRADIAPSWPLIGGPKDVVEKLAKAVGVEGITIDCSSKGPDIVFHIGGVEYTLTKDDYTLHDDDDKTCYWVFVGAPVEDYWLIGQPFFRKFYTVFEFGDEQSNKAHRIGFALAT